MGRVLLPGTDLRVSSLCLGAGGIGTRLDREQSFALLDAYLEMGGNFLDTARVYGDWVPGIERSISEKTIGAWMAERGMRDRVVLATKGAHFYLETPHLARVHPEEIVKDLEGSLRSLQVDHIDLYWLHRDDPTRPVEEIVETLNAQMKAGKIRWFGASNWRSERLRSAQAYAASQGLKGFVADQMFWNAAVLAIRPFGDPTVQFMDEDQFAFHQETGMAAIPYTSQAGGLFSRMHNGTLEQMAPGARSLYRLEETGQRYQQMRRIMEETGLTITQVILGYLHAQPFVTVPIVGCHSQEQLADSMRALDVRLTPEQVAAIGPAPQSLP